MGILNVTPDSFSDGGLYLDPSKAEERALEIERQGADILDMGAESSRPGLKGITITEEIQRLLPVLERILPKLSIPVSVDTWKFEVMQRVLDCGVSIINDIRALEGDSRIPKLLASYGVSVVLMHMRGTPVTMQENTQYESVSKEVRDYLHERAKVALQAGIRRENIILDPGIGFGKSVEGNFEILRSLSDLKALGFPVMVGLSRKSFISKMLGPDPIGMKSAMAALHAFALNQGADILRVHDMIEAKSVLAVSQNLRKKSAL